jgi:type I restriction enzyme S subunit
MSSEWIQTTIGNQVQLQRGIDITKRDFRDGMIPVVSSGGVGGFHDTPTGTAPGVILGRKGIVGSVYYLPTDYWAHDTTLWVKDFKGNLPRYIYYFFKSITETLKDLDVGSANPTLNRNHVHPIETSWAPLSDQKAIAHILGTLDDKIELNRKTNKTLEAMAKALFKSWFVDFDPVRAKSEGRPTGFPAEISDLFPDSFEDSELGEFPSGWEMETLGEILDVDKGVSYKGDFLSDTEGLPMVNLGCFAGGGAFRAEKMKFYAGEYRERHLASAGDLLVANTDMTQNRIILGAPIIVPPWRGRDKFLFSHHTFAIRFRRSKSTFARFIYFTLLKPSFRQVAAGHATGTTVLALPKDGITDYQTVIPPAGLLNVFAAKVEALYQKCQALTEQSELLAKTRDALLPKLISGEIRIPDAERMLEEVGV